MPINHVSLPVSDLETAFPVYLAALKPLKYKVFKNYPHKIVGLETGGIPEVWLFQASEQADLKVVPAKVHLALGAPTRAVVRQFHEAALKAGFQDNGGPGLRPQYADGYYAAFVKDEDGNNIECICFSPWWLVALQGLKYPSYLAILSLAF